YRGYVYPVIGLSPQKAMVQENIEEDIRLVRQNPDVLAIGEIGLDYHWAKTEVEKELQRKTFNAFLDLALEMNLPVVIHSRDSHEEMIQTLVDKKIKKAMLHCFAGDEKVAKTAVENNYVISIPPIPSKNRKKVIKAVDLSFLVTETDAPAIGREPLDVAKSAEMIAKAKGVSVGEVAERTRENAIKFFSLKL
ncbi:TatD family hydrolase, partial [Candidatus Micrarchaeota archaeon]|nr:TatD family hydrolase [Candidatus Micrarchaeota archaeon]